MPSLERLTIKSSCESLASSADSALTTPPSRTRSFKTTRCESIETTIRNQRLFFAGAEARQSKERLPSREMFGTMAGGENPRPGGQFNLANMYNISGGAQPPEDQRNTPPWCLELRPRCGPLQPKRPESGTRGVLEAAERFVERWHEDEAQPSRQRRGNVVGGARGNRGRGVIKRSGRKSNQGSAGRGGAKGGVEREPRWTKVRRRWQTG